MKQFAVPFQQLVERRLWPLAVLLVAAAAAVPFLLAKDDPAPAPSSTAPATPAERDDATPIVALADDARIETRRHVLGAPKDPFRPAIKAKPAKTPAPRRTVDRAETPTTPAQTPTSGGTGTTAPVGGTGTGTSTPAAPTAPPVATPTPAPKPTYPLYSLVARFGGVKEPKTRRLVLRSTGLPSNSRIGLVYKGVLKDRKTAVFWAVSGTEVDGDGRCVPGPENCQYVQIKLGETLFFTMPGGDQYELDLLAINTDEAKTGAARAQASAALPRRLHAGGGRYRYDWRSGVLTEAPRRELEAAASHSSARVPVS